MNQLFPILFLLISCTANAQSRINGKFDASSGIFETKDTTYWIGEFENGVARISKDGLIGLVDSAGRIIFQPKFDVIIEPKQPARYIVNGRYGLLDIKNGKEIKIADDAPISFIGEFKEGMAKYADSVNHKKGKVGFITNEGKIVVKPLAWEVTDFVAGYAEYYLKKSYGVVDKAGKKTVLFKSKDLMDFYYQQFFGERHKQLPTKRTQAYFIVPKIINGKQAYYYLNSDLKRISDDYFELVNHFIENKAVVQFEGKWCIIKGNGDLIKTEYNFIQSIGNGNFLVAVFGEGEWHNEDKWGVIEYNKILVPVAYRGAGYLFNNLYWVKTVNGVVLFNTDNPCLKQISCDLMGEVNSKFGYCIKLTETPPPFRFNWAEGKPIFFPNKVKGYIQFFDTGGFIDNDSFYMEEFKPTVIKSMQKEINRIFGGYFSDPKEKVGKRQPLYRTKYLLALKERNGKYEVIELKGYDGFLALGNEKFLIVKDVDSTRSEYGIVDIDGKELVPIEYDEIVAGIFNLLPARKGNKWGLINYNNKPVASFFYDELILATAGFIARKGEKYGYVDLTGKELLPFEYDKLEDAGSILNATKGEETYLINNRGERLE